MIIVEQVKNRAPWRTLFANDIFLAKHVEIHNTLEQCGRKLVFRKRGMEDSRIKTWYVVLGIE